MWLLWAIERRPNTKSLDLLIPGIELTESGHIKVNDEHETSAHGIYAIGDVIEQRDLSSAAVAVGRWLGNRLLGSSDDGPFDYRQIPQVLSTQPPAGSVGLSFDEAIAQYGQDEVKEFTNSVMPISSALCEHGHKFTMRIVFTKKEERVLGIHIVGPGVDEMLQGLAVAVRLGVTKKQLQQTVGIHPSSSEEFTLI